MKLTANYASKPAEELPLLFQRILQNTIRDYYRRQKVRSLWTSLFSSFAPNDQDKNPEEFDILETLEVEQQSNAPDIQLEKEQTLEIIEKSIRLLPPR